MCTKTRLRCFSLTLCACVCAEVRVLLVPKGTLAPKGKDADRKPIKPNSHWDFLSYKDTHTQSYIQQLLFKAEAVVKE